MAANNQGHDPMLTWAVVLCVFLVAMFFIWIVGYRTLGPAMLEVKRAELYALSFISDDAAKAYYSMGRNTEALRANYANTARSKAGYTEMWKTVVAGSKVVGDYYRWPISLLLALMIAYILFKYPSSRFKGKYDLDRLIGVQAKSWPVVQPFVKYNPAKGVSRAPGGQVPNEMPLFAEALYPEEWMAFHRIRLHGGVPDRDQIRRSMLEQLGPIFNGLDQLPNHLYCLMAVFALKGARERQAADDLLGELAGCWSESSGFHVSASVKATATRALTNRKMVEPLLEVVGKHAYVATAMIGALAWARREGGVLAPAQFVWLRGEHREIWYPLNNLGRRAFHVEAAGAMAHYQAEIEANRALAMPRLDAAVVAIVQYLSETRARIPELEAGAIKAPAGNKGMLRLANQKKT